MDAWPPDSHRVRLASAPGKFVGKTIVPKTPCARTSVQMTKAKLLPRIIAINNAPSVNDDALPARPCFRSPWQVEDLTGCFVVKAESGQELAYIYYEDDATRRAITRVLSREEARRLATSITKLPDVL
jgi:hypothetical protein